MNCNIHIDHPHIHGEGCGHEPIQHDDRIDYIHDDCVHHMHGDHVDEHPKDSGIKST